MTKKGFFITLEGIDGSGKTTFLQTISDIVAKSGKNFVLTREPGGTKVGEKIRKVLLDINNKEICDETELLLMFAARAQHIEQIIKPALAEDKVVVCDRFIDSSYAYQVGGRGVDVALVKLLDNWILGDLKPNLTFIFDVDVELGLKRTSNLNETIDRFEQAQKDFFERVRSYYLKISKSDSKRYKVIDSNKSLEKVSLQVTKYLYDSYLC